MDELLFGFCIGFIFASTLWLSVLGIEINLKKLLKKLIKK